MVIKAIGSFKHNGLIWHVFADGYVQCLNISCHYTALKDTPRLKAEYDRAGQERFTVCYLQSYQYAVYDTTDDLYVDRHRNPSNVGYFTEEEARAVAKHLNSL